MSDEWGVFSDEGCLAEFWTKEQAEAASVVFNKEAEQDDYTKVEPICGDHPGMSAWHCDECESDDEDLTDDE